MQYYRKYLLKSSTVSYTTDIAPCCHGNQNIRIMLDRKEKKKKKKKKEKIIKNGAHISLLEKS